jgi:1-acyl-sn-glycerol-3-phosphate acyltransferase
MQNIVVDKPYRFVPPHRGTLFLRFLHHWLPGHLRRAWGIERMEWRGVERLKQSLAEGHGVLLASNHCRPCDPLVVGLVEREINRAAFILTSWHLFMEGRVKAWLLRRAGCFSVYREGLDREALRSAVALLAEAQRPLLIFPEGFVSRTNDRLGALQEGTTFIARAAARARAEASPPGQVVIHPVAVRYFFHGDLAAAVGPVLQEIEARLTLRPLPDQPPLQRVCRVGEALLALKEVEYLGQAQAGDLRQRLERLLEAILGPLEEEWLKGRQEAGAMERIKRLRAAILPDMAADRVSPAERARRWRHLANVYLAQQVHAYPPDYLHGQPTPERLLETVERFEEDLTDQARIHRPLRVVIQVGEAIEVRPERRPGGQDPLLKQLEHQLRTLLAELAASPQHPPAS